MIKLSKDIIQINRFSQLHDGKNVFFCKTDFISQVFRDIGFCNNNVILISGNSDFCITNTDCQKMPSNIHKWFCQNKLCDNDKLEIIPLGMDNNIDCKIPNHGNISPYAAEHHMMLSQEYHDQPTKLIYANFSLETNINRKKIYQICQTLPYITCDIVAKHQECNQRNYTEYIKQILQHQAVLCPQGNLDGDNHRIYESLYLNRVPITFNKPLYNELHHKFPTVLIENFEQLLDEQWLTKKISWAKQSFNSQYWQHSYWEYRIKEAIGQLC